MRLSIFEALRVPATASESAVRAAFRRLIRRLYSSARDSSGDVEEGLRFCNAASAVLLVESDRNHYEGEYANLLSGGQDLRRSHAAEVENESVGVLSDSPVEMPNAANSTTSVRPGLVSLLEIAGGTPGSMRMAWALLALLAVVALGALIFSLRMSAGVMAQYAVLMAAIAATAAAVGVALHRTRDGSKQKDPGARLRDVAVVKWRRERSVFMGSRLRNEEAAWVYRLRVAETDRARHTRTTRVPALMRMLARLIDYGLWGGIVYLLCVLVALLFKSPYLTYLTSWWLLPIIIVLTWIPIEAFCLHTYRRTPGKWLLGLRCRPGVTSLSSPDQVRESPRYALQRAAGVAALGMAGGLPLLNLIAPSLNARVGNTEHETRWDALGDSVVTRTPLTGTQAGFAAAVLGLTVASFLAIWWPSFVQTGEIVKEARSLASQVTWAQLFKSNPKDWIPKEVLDPTAWNAKERVAKIGDQVVDVAGGVATGVATAVIGSVPGAAPTSDANAAEVGKQKSRFIAYAEQANKAIDANNAGAAFALCERWVREEPKSALAWKCYGLGLQMNRRHADALQALRRAQRIDSSDRSLHEAIRLSFSQLNEVPPDR
jgi:hypothetical protein